MKKISALAYIACLCVPVWATDLSQTYKVIDVLDEKKTTEEMWVAHEEEEKIDGADAFRIIKTPRNAAPREELHSFWYKEIRVPGKSTYLKEVLVVNPDLADDGETGFGFTEEKDVESGKVLRNWPVFFRVYEGTEMKRIIFDAFLSGDDHLNVLRDYMQGNNIFPLREVHTLFKNGKIISHTIFTRE